MNKTLKDFAVPISPDNLRKLKQCFEPIAPPERRPGQYYQPENRSWYETQFCYKVVIKADTTQDSNDSVIFGGEDSHPFFRVKKLMQDDPVRWGDYRTSWFASIHSGRYVWYFMTRNHALEFRLWVDL